MTGVQIGGVVVLVLTGLNLRWRIDIGSWYIGVSKFEDWSKKGDRDRVYRDRDPELFRLNASADVIAGLAMGLALIFIG